MCVILILIRTIKSFMVFNKNVVKNSAIKSVIFI